MVELLACISDCSILTVITGFSHANQGASLTNQLFHGHEDPHGYFWARLYGLHAKSMTRTKIQKKNHPTIFKI